jgi:hypothetical protein
MTRVIKARKTVADQSREASPLPEIASNGASTEFRAVDPIVLVGTGLTPFQRSSDDDRGRTRRRLLSACGARHRWRQRSRYRIRYIDKLVHPPTAAASAGSSRIPDP